MNFKSNYFGVLGLGVSGIATIKFMLDHGYRFVSWDDDAASIVNCAKTLQVTENKLNICSPENAEWQNIDYLISSPGIAGHKLLDSLGSKIDVICDIEFFYMHFPHQKYIAVTGTNGKSTTVKLISHILQVCGYQSVICGNIGEAILNIRPNKNDILVVELSSYQLELVKSFKARIAVILNISPDHLARYGSMAKDKQYIEEFKTHKINSILAIGLAFCGKQLELVHDNIDLPTKN